MQNQWIKQMLQCAASGNRTRYLYCYIRAKATPHGPCPFQCETEKGNRRFLEEALPKEPYAPEEHKKKLFRRLDFTRTGSISVTAELICATA